MNYEVLDRHVGWLGDLGFRGMVVDEAHFIKNKSSQRSQHVLELSERIRARVARPLLMALTGTPLINDIEDFRAIWQFLGWIDDKKPLGDADGGARGDRADPGGLGLLPCRPQQRDRPGHRPPPQGRRGRRHPRASHRRPAGRARRQGQPFDPRRRARPRPPAGVAVRARARRSCVGPRRAPTASTTRWCARSRRRSARTPASKTRRERVQHDATHRPGQGRPRRRLRGPARAQRRQGRLLRQAHRRDGRRRGDLREARHQVHLDPWRPDLDEPADADRRVRQRPRHRTSPSAR